MVCSIVHGSPRRTTARTSVTTLLSWITGAVRLVPALWFARKLAWRPQMMWSTPTPATEAAAVRGNAQSKDLAAGEGNQQETDHANRIGEYHSAQSQ